VGIMVGYFYLKRLIYPPALNVSQQRRTKRRYMRFYHTHLSIWTKVAAGCNYFLTSEYYFENITYFSIIRLIFHIRLLALGGLRLSVFYFRKKKQLKRDRKSQFLELKRIHSG